MKKILVIDADNDTLKIFSSGLKEHADKFELLTTNQMNDAHEVLSNLKIDMIAIDLKAEQMSNLDQLSTLVKEHSKTPFFVFAEAGNPEFKIKIKVLGIQNYFEKPLDTNKIAGKIVEDIFPNVGGQVTGISLPSFLQMSEMEKSSCTLKITSKGKVGYLFLSSGALIAAKTKDKSKEDAAYEILSWDDSAIEIEKAAKKKKRDIKMPLMNLLMEGLRIKDEKSANQPQSAQYQTSPELKISNVKDLISKPESVSKPEPPPASAIEASEPTPPPKNMKKEPTAEKPSPPPEKTAPLSDYHKEIIEKAKEEKRKKNLLLLSMVVILFVCSIAGTIIWFKVIKPNHIKNQFEELMAQVGKQQDLEEMEKMLLNYINANPDSIYAKSAKEKLQEIRYLMEEHDYDQAIQKVNALATDNAFESNATAIYQNFLRKYPQSTFTEEIQNRIASLSSVKDNIDFNKLQEIDQNKYIERLKAYRAYLTRHPEGQHRKKVFQFIKDISNEYYQHIKQEVAQCEKEHTLDLCIQINVDDFINLLNSNYLSGKIKALLKRVKDKKDYNQLLARSEEIDNDLKAQRKIFTDYLKKNPTSTEKSRIKGEIKKIDYKLGQILEWKNLVNYIMNPQKDVFSRLSKLETYMNSHRNSPYLQEAQKALKILEKEKKDVLWRQKIEQERKQKERKEQLALQRERERIALASKKMSRLVAETKGRFKDNHDGTVIDTKTGMMWSLLDSQTQLQECVDFEKAVQYVKDLDTGGYHDWRVPTANELVIIYKNQPFFPSERPLWYWSRDIVLQGWNKKINIVTSKQEIGWKKALVMPDKCGVVRAIRP